MPVEDKIDLKESFEKEVQEQEEYSDVEKQAMEKGWNPDPSNLPEDKEFVSAEEYIKRESFFKKIDSMKKEIDGYKKSVEQMKSHFERVAENDRNKIEAEYKSRISQLKAEKKEALDQGDSARVVEIDDEILNTRPPEVERPRNEANQIINEWKSANPWYEKDEFLGDEADILFSEYARRRVPLNEALEKAEKHLKKKYPEMFKNPEREAPPSVEGATPPRSAKKSISDKDLTADEREVYRNMDRLGLFKGDKDGSARHKYLRDVVELRD